MKKECSNNKLKYTIIIVCVVMSGILCIYFIMFHCSLSSKSDDWGNFGDFVGGTCSTLLTLLNVLIFYRLTTQMNELNDKNSNKQQKINSLQILIDLQRFHHSRFVKASDPIIKGEEDAEVAIEQVTSLYFLINWARFDHIFSGKCEKLRKDVCNEIYPIIGVDKNGKKIKASKQLDDEAWNNLRVKLNTLEVEISKVIVSMTESLMAINEEETKHS